MNNCFYLRLIPDHTGLLEEGEAYVAMDQEFDRSLSKASHVLAMRSPAYFAGDLRKLKLVHYETLEERSQGPIKPLGPLRFFRKLRYGLVLSTKGSKSEADAMSGGDFDGDKAWVCWDRSLLEQVEAVEPENTDTKDFEIRKSKPNVREQMLHERATLRDKVAFALHFRKHQHQLGILSNLLDRVIDSHGLGQDSPAKPIGTQAFLQVSTDSLVKSCAL